jgi:septal ring factor EnvC (AmiA/AmiB activator)
MKEIILTFLKKNKLTTSLIIALTISVIMNIVFYSSSTVNFKKIEENKKKINELELKVKEGDGQLKEINLQREERKKEIDSLSKIIDTYEHDKTKRKTKNDEKVKKINNLDANQSLDNFINWADGK